MQIRHRGREEVPTAVFSTVLHAALLLIGDPSQSTHLYLSYIGPQWCPVLSVMMHFPWSPVSMDKSQQCCQNSRTASAESICKVSSWAIASSRAIQYPEILRCLWPPSATQGFSFLGAGAGGGVFFFLFLFFKSCLKNYTDLSSVS